MSAPPRGTEPGLTKRDELAVSGAAMSHAPWRTALAVGAVATGGDFLLHLAALHLGVAPALSAGTMVFFTVAGGGAVLRSKSGRAMRWARNNPWRFAVVPAAATFAIVLVLSLVLSGGVIGPIFAALWHGAITYGLTGVAGTVAGGRQRNKSSGYRPGGSY
jgi:hypothetical protein